MSSPSIDDKLKRLDEKEVTVLYWKCQGLTRDLIGEQMGYGEDMVQVFATRMYNKLEFDPKQHHSRRKRILDEDYCPALMSYGKTLREIIANLHAQPAESNPDPQVGSPGWLIVVQDRAREEVQQEVFRAIQQHPQATLQEIFHLPLYIDERKPRIEHRGASIVRIVVAALLVVLVALGAWLMGWTSHKVTPIAQITQVVTQNVTQAITQNVTAVSTQVVTANVTQVVQAITKVVPTPLPTATPVPTATPNPAILFANNFADGPDPRWQIQGDYTIVNHIFIANGNVSLFLPGDWSNYQVRIEYDGWCDTVFCNATLGLRATDAGNMVAVAGSAGHAGLVSWVEYTNGQAQGKTGSQFTVPQMDGEIVLQARGDTYQVVGSFPIVIPGHPNGGLFLKIYKGFTLKSVSISQLP